MLDVLIRDGLVVDGTGKPGYKADVAVKDGKILRIAPRITEKAEEVINAKGLVVAPGFVDCHNHSDAYVFIGSDAYNYLEQGVTTQVCGNCGVSMTPCGPDGLRWMESEEERAIYTKLAATPAGFMDLAKNASLGVNVAFLVGHGTIRQTVMGYDPAVPDETQLNAMCDWVEQAMDAGFLGYSSGLIYAPSAYGKTAELIALAKAMAPYGGIYASHIRNEGDGVVDAVKEAIHIGEEAGVQVQISHLKVMGKHNEGTSEVLLKLIEDANRRGVTVFADQYPFEASSASLRSRIPDRYHAGGVEELLKRLQDPAVRADIDQLVFQNKGSASGVSPIASRDILIASLENNPEYVGMTLAQVAEQTGKTPVDALCDLLVENEGRGQGIFFNQNMSDLLKIMASPWVLGGSDSENLPDLRVDKNTRFGIHPRKTSAFVRRLELQRDHNLCSMEEAVHRVTGAPAKAFKLDGVGVLTEGVDADIAVLDYENLRAISSYEYPYRGNEGICHVLVGGKVAVKDGRYTGVRNGKLLRRR